MVRCGAHQFWTWCGRAVLACRSGERGNVAGAGEVFDGHAERRCVAGGLGAVETPLTVFVGLERVDVYAEFLACLQPVRMARCEPCIHETPSECLLLVLAESGFHVPAYHPLVRTVNERPSPRWCNSLENYRRSVMACRSRGVSMCVGLETERRRAWSPPNGSESILRASSDGKQEQVAPTVILLPTSEGQAAQPNESSFIRK